MKTVFRISKRKIIIFFVSISWISETKIDFITADRLTGVLQVMEAQTLHRPIQIIHFYCKFNFSAARSLSLASTETELNGCRSIISDNENWLRPTHLQFIFAFVFQWRSNIDVTVNEQVGIFLLLSRSNYRLRPAKIMRTLRFRCCCVSFFNRHRIDNLYGY